MNLPPVPEADDSDGFQSDTGSDDSERELQLAFEKGLLKPGALNVVREKSAREPVNNVAGLKAALSKISKAHLDWVERLDVSVPREDLSASDAAATNIEEDDFKRELVFYRQAQAAVAVALPRLHKLAVPTQRPKDYYAQMAKSDRHMTKVRAKLVDIQEAKKKWETARRLREERKFATKVQKQVALEKIGEKRRLNDAVKKHRKGMKEQLEDVLENRRSMREGEDDLAPPAKRAKGGPPAKGTGQKRTFKDAKFGFGGRKKGTKGNNEASFGAQAAPGHNVQRKKKGAGGAAAKGKAKKRPGKARRKAKRN